MKTTDSVKISSIPKRKNNNGNVVSDSSSASGKVESSSSSVESSNDKTLAATTVPKKTKSSVNVSSDTITSNGNGVSSSIIVESIKDNTVAATTTTEDKAVSTTSTVPNAVNLNDDMGINIADIVVPTVTSNDASSSVSSTNNNNTQKLPEALLRCAYIQNSNSQSVVFWCEELTKWSFKCQNKIQSDIRDGKSWVTSTIPFISPGSDQPYSLYLHRNNVQVKGMHGSFGIRLFHYTLGNHFQTELHIKNTARNIVRYANEDCKAKLIFDENRLFLYNKPCVWSNLIGIKGAIDKLKRDTNDVVNERYSSNPRFWDDHMEFIKKFFFINKLQVDVAAILNAPLENIDNAIERTPELVASVLLRRNGITATNIQQVTYSGTDIDPEDEVNIENVIDNGTTEHTETNTQVTQNATENPENE